MIAANLITRKSSLKWWQTTWGLPGMWYNAENPFSCLLSSRIHTTKHKRKHHQSCSSLSRVSRGQNGTEFSCFFFFSEFSFFVSRSLAESLGKVPYNGWLVSHLSLVPLKPLVRKNIEIWFCCALHIKIHQWAARPVGSAGCFWFEYFYLWGCRVY